MSTREPKTAAIIGMGNASRYHVEGYAKAGIEVIAKLDLEGSQAAALEADIVSICTPDHLHAGYAIDLLDAGKWVFCEKPLATTSVDFWDMHEHADRLGCNLPLSLHPPFIDLIARAKAGEVGKIYYIEADYNYGKAWKLKPPYWRSEPGYSMILGGGIHLVDLLFEIAPGGLFIPWSLRPGIKYDEDMLVATRFFEIEGICAGRVVCNFGYDGPHEHHLTVWGDKGPLTVRNREPTDKTACLLEFVAAIREGRPTNGLRGLRATEACLRLEGRM